MSEDLQPARTEPLKIGVLISGSGTNLQALIDAIDAGTLNAQIVIVISSKPEAKGLLRAQKAGIQTLSLNASVYENARALPIRSSLKSFSVPVQSTWSWLVTCVR